MIPKPLHALQNDLGRVASLIKALEHLDPDDGPGTDRLYRTIEARLLQACERIGIVPHERRALHDLVAAQRTELERRQLTINTLIQEVRR